MDQEEGDDRIGGQFNALREAVHQDRNRLPKLSSFQDQHKEDEWQEKNWLHNKSSLIDSSSVFQLPESEHADNGASSGQILPTF